MDLAELKFVVDTKQLEEAAKKVAELGTAVSKVNKPMQDLNKESAKTNKELSKSQEAAAKAAIAQLKLEQAQNKSTDAIGKSASVLERQNLILEYMAQGNSKGQASILATAKAAGALDDEMLQLNTTLKTQRTLIGGDPFDKSIGLMQKLQNEYKTTNEVSNLFNKNLGLTEKQMTDLAREKERLIALYSIEGKSLNGLSAEYDQLIRKSVEINQANDARTNSMKAQIKAQNDATKANNYISSEMERLNRLTESNGTITSATNNKQIKFEQALKASGKTAKEQADLLKLFNEQMLSTQKAAGNRQVDYLSRALAPQITDIAVGLATGQSPLTILLQQGGQLRDQFGLAGVAGKDMGDMLTKATIGMASSVKDVAVAVGSALGGAFLATGKAVKTFMMDITGTGAALEYVRYQIALLDGSNGILMKSFQLMGSIITGVVGVAIFSLVAGFIALGVAMSDVIKEENALNRALNLSGAALGLNLDMAYDAARGMKDVGVSTGTALTVLTEMAKVGGMSSDSLQMVATTAKAMKTAFDIPIADTVKQFKELQEKPTESLTKLAIKLGTIPVEILKQVDAYERAGNSIKAAEIATKAYADAGKDAADRTVENFGTITRLGIGLKKIWDGTWESIMNIGRRDTLSDQLKQAEENLRALQGTRGADVSGSRTNQRMLASMKLVDDLKNQMVAEKEIADQKAAASADATKFDNDKKKRDEDANKLKAEAKKLEADRDRLIEKVTNAYINQSGAVDHLTKSEIDLLEIKNSDEYKSQNQTFKNNIDALYQIIIANEKLVQSEKDKVTQMTAINSLMGKSDGLGKDYYSTLKQLDNAFVDGNISLERYTELLNKLYQTTPDAKRFAAAQAESAKAMAGITADRANVAAEYGSDFKTNDEKAAIKNLSDYRKKTAQADAEYQKQIADAGKNITEEETAMYKAELDAKNAYAKEFYDHAEYQLTDSYKRNEAYKNAFEDLFKGMGDAIVDFALTGKTSFSDMVNSMIVGLIKLEMQMAMTNMYKSMGGSQGIISTITSAFTGTPVASAKGNVFDSGNMQAFAKGGAFTNGIVSSPTSFNMGVMGEAGPEAIMPLRRGSDGSLGVAASGGSSGGNVSVQVINNSSSQATTNETTDSKGNRKIEVVIGDMTAGEISRSGSASQKSIKSTFGLQPQLIRR
jgi:lambda family phage tail tape measure protein